MMTIRRGFIAVILVVASAIALAAQSRTQAQEGMSLTDSVWHLSAIAGAMPLAGRGPLDLRFAQEGEFTTSAGCNRFKGTAEIAGDTITFPDRIAGTMMACPTELATQEERVLALLAEVTGFRIEADDLLLLDADGTELLRYRPEGEEPDALVETQG